MRAPTAKSLTLDLISSMRGHAMPVAALVAAGELFGIAENAMRVAVARLLAAGRLGRDDRGHYRFAASADAVDARVRDWRKLEERTRRWDGRWLGILPGARRRGAAKRRERALRFGGFAPLSEELAIRPNNLQSNLAETRATLRAVGLEDGAMVFRLSDLDAECEAQARALWNPEALAARYAAAQTRIAVSQHRLAGMRERASMVESFLVGGAALRELALDPLLPAQIASPDPRRALVAAMRDYDRAGRAAWAAFLDRFSVRGRSAPGHGVSSSIATLHP